MSHYIHTNIEEKIKKIEAATNSQNETETPFEKDIRERNAITDVSEAGIYIAKKLGRQSLLTECRTPRYVKTGNEILVVRKDPRARFLSYSFRVFIPMEIKAYTSKELSFKEALSSKYMFFPESSKSREKINLYNITQLGVFYLSSMCVTENSIVLEYHEDFTRNKASKFFRKKEFLVEHKGFLEFMKKKDEELQEMLSVREKKDVK